MRERERETDSTSALRGTRKNTPNHQEIWKRRRFVESDVESRVELTQKHIISYIYKECGIDDTSNLVG